MFNLFKSFRQDNGAVVLMYHRVTDLPIDPWKLAVSPEHFEGQLTVMSKKYRVIDIDELLHQQKQGKIKNKTICLTFDDGYLDNYINAKPLLEKFNCPATFFISPYYLETQQVFWWDDLLNIILLSPELPKIINIRQGNHVFTRRVKEQKINPGQSKELKSWVWDQPYPTERCEIYMALWVFLRPLHITEINDCLKQLKASIGNLTETPAMDIAMSNEQLKDLVCNPLFKAGIHTMTHPALALHTKEEQQKELLTCKATLEQQLNQKFDIVAYPYGNFNDETLQVMQENHLSAGFTTQAQTITRNSDTYTLGRFQVSNQPSKDFEQQLKQWFR